MTESKHGQAEGMSEQQRLHEEQLTARRQAHSVRDVHVGATASPTPTAHVQRDAAYYDEVRRAVGRGAPSLLLGTSTKSLKRSLAKLMAAERGESQSASITAPETSESSTEAAESPASAVRSWERIRSVMPDLQLVPLLGNVAAGAPILANEGIIEYLPIPPQYARQNAVFAMRVRGDSMIGDGILDGDYIYVAPEAEPENGDMVVVLIGDETMVRRLRHEGSAIRLESSNPAYTALVLEEDAEQVTIQGKVIGTARWDIKQGRRPEELSQPSDTKAAAVPPLTEAEKAVLRLFVAKQSTSNIASELYVSRSTVQRHVRNIYQKLGVSNRREAIIRSGELGLSSHGSGPRAG